MNATTSDVLSQELVAELVTLADAPDVRAIAIVGSAARGDTTRWSDIDVQRYVTADPPPTRAAFSGDRLVMIHTTTPAAAWKELGNPERAIWAVPALRDMRVLVDRDGELARLAAAAGSFEWEALRARAREVAAQRVVQCGEYVYKIRGAIERADEAAALHAAVVLSHKCAHAVAVGLGVFIRTENEFYARVRDAAGTTWMRAHLAAHGLDGGRIFARGAAACRLFAETAKVLDDTLDEHSRTVVRRAIDIVP